MKDGEVVMAPCTNMPDDVKAMAQATQAKITSGELEPFKARSPTRRASWW